MIVYLILLLLFIFFALLRFDKSFKPFDLKSTLPLRGVLALGIVLHHTAMKYFNDGDPIYLFWIFKNMGSPIVAIFFFLTGYGLCVSLRKKGNKYLDGFLKKRFSSFLPEFLFLTFSMVGVAWLFYDISIKRQMVEFFINENTPLPNSWFVYAIIYVYLAFFFAAKMSRCSAIKTGLVFIALILIYAITLSIFGYGNYWYNSIPSVILGYYTAYSDFFYGDKKAMLKKYVLWFVFGIFGVSVFFLDNAVVRFVIINVSTLAVYFCVRYYGFPQWKWLLYIGTISLNIYLIHGIVLNWAPRKWNGYIVYLLVISTTIILATILKNIRSISSKR